MDSRPIRQPQGTGNPQTTRNSQNIHRPRVGPSAVEAGFSLAELAVASLIAAFVLLGAFLIFDFNSRLSRVQIQVSDLQQSHRIAQQDVLRQVRMAGRGNIPALFAVNVADNVDGSSVMVGPNRVVDQSDILTIRGVFSDPIYQVNVLSGFTYTPAARSGTVIIDSKSPGGIPQPLEALKEVLDNGLPDALIMVSSNQPATYAVVEIQGGSVSGFDVDGNGTIESGELRATVTFSSNPGVGSYNSNYLAMSSGGAYPPTLTAAAFVGVLEEYRYYIRDDQSLVGGNEPKLSRARFFPNTEVVYAGNNSNAGIDIADNITDFQVALAIDRDGSRQIDSESDPDSDEWLFNHADDQDTDSYWGFGDADDAWNASLFQLRITTVAQTETNDPGFESEAIDWVENNEYAEPVHPTNQDERYKRSFRRRVMRTLIDLRNIG